MPLQIFVVVCQQLNLSCAATTAHYFTCYTVIYRSTFFIILKVLAKMGISTLQSYKGAQVFEAIGLKDEVIDLAFCGTASRVQGVGFDVIFEEIIRRHSLGFPENEKVIHDLTNPGEFHWRAEGEVHAWNPESISYLQKASTENNIKSYEKNSN